MLLLLGCVHQPPAPLRPTAPTPVPALAVIPAQPVDPVGTWIGALPTMEGPLQIRCTITGAPGGYSGSIAVGPSSLPAVVGVNGDRLTIQVASVGLTLLGNLDGATWHAVWNQASQATPVALERQPKP